MRRGAETVCQREVASLFRHPQLAGAVTVTSLANSVTENMLKSTLAYRAGTTLCDRTADTAETVTLNADCTCRPEDMIHAAFHVKRLKILFLLFGSAER